MYKRFYYKMFLKHVWWILSRPAILIKRDSDTYSNTIFMWTLQNFQEHLFCKISANSYFEHLWCNKVLQYHCRIKDLLERYKKIYFIKTCSLIILKCCLQFSDNFLCEILRHLLSQNNYNTRFFYKQRFFSTQPQCCLTF